MQHDKTSAHYHEHSKMTVDIIDNLSLNIVDPVIQSINLILFPFLFHQLGQLS